ncbi:MAG: AAA family ATPase [Patescibacteria group bacterium]
MPITRYKNEYNNFSPKAKALEDTNFIKSLSLKNFRSYPKAEFVFDPVVNLFIGPNGSGKSNLLEVLHFLATAHSYRAEALRELIKIGDTSASLELTLADGTCLEAIIILETENSSRAKCVYKVNGVVKKRSDFLGNYYAVFFSPADIKLVVGSPSRRRSVLDSILCQIEKDYSRACNVYEKALRQKNELLLGSHRGGNVKNLFLTRKMPNRAGRDWEDSQNGGNLAQVKSQVAVWNEILAKKGSYIQEKRQEFFAFANKTLSSLYPKMEVSSKRLVLNYVTRQVSKEALDESLEREITKKRSLIGPHRDDFLFLKDGWDLGLYGSRGEQRTAVFALKLCELAFLESKVGERVTLLLDDIFSELDKFYREKVLDTIEDRQSFITTAEEDLIPKKLLDRAKLFKLNTQ